MIQWLQLPLWLMQLHLTPAACIVYALIANRHRLSIATNAKSGTWADDQGVYCIYPRAELAAAAGLSITTISRAMRELVAAGLIIDRRLGQGMPNHLYIVDQATTAALDPIPDIQHADQLTLNDLVPADPADQPAAATADPAECLDMATATADPAECLDMAAATADPAEYLDMAAADRIAASTILESQHPRLPYNNNNYIKKYSDRSSRHTSDKLSAVRRCLAYAYGIDPDSVSQDQYNTAAERCTRALDVRNPVTYTAAIIAQMITTNHPEKDDLTDYDLDYFAAVRAYNPGRAVV